MVAFGFVPRVVIGGCRSESPLRALSARRCAAFERQECEAIRTLGECALRVHLTHLGHSRFVRIRLQSWRLWSISAPIPVADYYQSIIDICQFLNILHALVVLCSTRELAETPIIGGMNRLAFREPTPRYLYLRLCTKSHPTGSVVAWLAVRMRSDFRLTG